MISKDAVSILGKPNGLPQKTFCVLGVPRGGTTMIAQTLRDLGVDIGTDHTDGEDRAFISHQGRRDLFTDPSRAADKTAYLSSIRQVIADRSSRRDVWGWKDPIASFYIHEIYGQLRNPHYIFVTRDLGAVGQGEMVEENGAFSDKHILAHMYGAAEAVKSICGFLAGQDVPILLVSYERAMRDQNAFKQAMAEFTR